MPFACAFGTNDALRDERLERAGHRAFRSSPREWGSDPDTSASRGYFEATLRSTKRVKRSGPRNPWPQTSSHSAVSPAAREVCNGIDDDCNLGVDDVFDFIPLGVSPHLSQGRGHLGGVHVDPVLGVGLGTEGRQGSGVESDALALHVEGQPRRWLGLGADDHREGVGLGEVALSLVEPSISAP